LPEGVVSWGKTKTEVPFNRFTKGWKLGTPEPSEHGGKSVDKKASKTAWETWNGQIETLNLGGKGRWNTRRTNKAEKQKRTPEPSMGAGTSLKEEQKRRSWVRREGGAYR